MADASELLGGFDTFVDEGLNLVDIFPAENFDFLFF